MWVGFSDVSIWDKVTNGESDGFCDVILEGLLDGRKEWDGLLLGCAVRHMTWSNEFFSSIVLHISSMAMLAFYSSSLILSYWRIIFFVQLFKKSCTIFFEMPTIDTI